MEGPLVTRRGECYAPYRLMRVSFQPTKMTGTWVYSTGTWKEAIHYYTDILRDRCKELIDCTWKVSICIVKEGGTRILTDNL